MMENFIEYMWYLMSAPFKRIKKTINNWYVVCKIFGKKFDETKECILRARDESMVATCAPEMLSVHGNDRGLFRYEGEDLENFRKRIALYEEACSLGGTNEGVILAVKSLGYNNVSIKKAKEVEQDTELWAEFYVLIETELQRTVDFPILCKEVRKKKEVGAKDNYMFRETKNNQVYTGAVMTQLIYTSLKQEE